MNSVSGDQNLTECLSFIKNPDIFQFTIRYLSFLKMLDFFVERFYSALANFKGFIDSNFSSIEK